MLFFGFTSNSFVRSLVLCFVTLWYVTVRFLFCVRCLRKLSSRESNNMSEIPWSRWMVSVARSRQEADKLYTE